MTPNAYPARAGEWIVVHRKTLADISAEIREQIKRISEYPSATHLIPIREALAEIAKNVFTLEDISKL